MATDEPTNRKWTYAGLDFNYGHVGPGAYMLSARVQHNGAHVPCQVMLKEWDISQEDLQEIFMSKLSGALDEPTNCYACGAELMSDYAKTTYQFDNAMWVKFSGGYGMFVENEQFGGPEEVVICHECSHALCDTVPWIGRLINPHNSHAHKVDWIEQNPNHYGWDYDRQA